ncbi:MAG: family N-acetyltransferase [Actinomycetia bacterium]|nr:family N-acetyltransferase [Actinomycetes bacterium]
MPALFVSDGCWGSFCQLRHLLVLARADGFDSLFVSTKPDNTASQRLLAAMGVALVREGDSVTAWVDLVAAGQG